MTWSAPILRRIFMTVMTIVGVFLSSNSWGVVPCQKLRDEAIPFLCTIGACFEDDVARLVFADWLDEHGQGPRAEFIRVQIQKERVLKDSPEWKQLNQREAEIVKNVDLSTWVDPEVLKISDRDTAFRFEFRRGFFEGHSSTHTKFLEIAEKFDTIPGARLFVYLSNHEANLHGAVLKSPLAQSISVLDVSTSRASSAIIQAPKLKNLRTLYLAQNVDFPAEVYSAKAFEEVEKLSVPVSQLPAISAALAFENVRNLSVYQGLAADFATNIKLLAEQQIFRNLEALVLIPTTSTTGLNESLKVLAISPKIKKLKEFTLKNISSSVPDLVELTLAAKNLEKLDLDFTNEDLTIGFLNQIRPEDFTGLQLLTIRADSASIKLIMEKKLFPNLRVLNVDSRNNRNETATQLKQFLQERGGPENLTILLQ